MRYVFIMLTLVFALPVSSLEAQTSNLIYGQEALTIDLTPAYPAPGEAFTATVNDYALPVQGIGLRWVVDGKPLAADNQRTITLTAKDVGSITTIDLIVDLPGGGTSRATKRIEPVYLDIILEPQTRTPAFYHGRALPSIGSSVNATAIINGGAVSPGALIYTWRVNNETLENGAVRANNTVTFTMPRGQFATLSLEVSRLDGTLLGRRIFDIQNSEPRLVFYETNPLYGLTMKAVQDSLLLVGSSLSVRAEPYYLDLLTYNNPDYLEWKIDGVINRNPSANPYEVTVAQTGVSGSSRVNFHVRNTTQVLQGVQGGFRLTY